MHLLLSVCAFISEWPFLLPDDKCSWDTVTVRLCTFSNPHPSVSIRKETGNQVLGSWNSYGGESQQQFFWGQGSCCSSCVQLLLLPYLYSWVCAKGTLVRLGACLYSSATPVHHWQKHATVRQNPAVHQKPTHPCSVSQFPFNATFFLARTCQSQFVTEVPLINLLFSVRKCACSCFLCLFMFLVWPSATK